MLQLSLLRRQEKASTLLNLCLGVVAEVRRNNEAEAGAEVEVVLIKMVVEGVAEDLDARVVGALLLGLGQERPGGHQGNVLPLHLCAALVILLGLVQEVPGAAARRAQPGLLLRAPDAFP